MLEEINVYSRNLKFVSLAFIAYWVLQLKPKDGVIHLPLNDFEIMNPQYLPYFSYGILLYCAVRFYQSSINELTERYHNINGHVNYKNNKKTIMYKWLCGFCDLSIKNNSSYREQIESKIEEEVIRNNLEPINYNDYQLELENAYCYTKHKKIRIRCILHFTNSQIKHAYECDLTPNDGTLYKVLMLKQSLLFSLNSDGFSDYVLPWVLFISAVFLSIHNEIILPLKPKFETMLNVIIDNLSIYSSTLFG